MKNNKPAYKVKFIGRPDAVYTAKQLLLSDTSNSDLFNVPSDSAIEMPSSSSSSAIEQPASVPAFSSHGQDQLLLQSYPVENDAMSSR